MFKYFENLIDPYQPYAPVDKPPKRLFAFMWSYLHPFKRLFWVVGALSLIGAAVEIVMIFYVGRLVDLMATSGAAAFWHDNGFEMLLMAGFLLILRPGFQILHSMYLNNTLMPNIGTIFRYRGHRHVIRQSVGWFENDFAGRIANRVVQVPPAAGEVVFQVFDALTFMVAYAVGALILLGDIDVRLMAPLLAWIILYGLLLRMSVKRIGPASEEASNARSQVTGRVVDSYTNIHSVKMFASTKHEEAYVDQSVEYARTTFQKEMRIFSILDLGWVVLNGLLVVGVVGWALWLWINAGANMGLVAAAAVLVLRLNSMSGWAMWAVTSFFRQLGVVAEGMRSLASDIELLDAPDAKPLNYTQGQIDFSGVTHAYGRDTGGVRGLNLTVQPGEKIGLVGESGAGKSTLIKLLLRFYDLEQGAILVDGQNIAQITQDSLRTHIGVVQQDSSLLHRSIRANIAFGQPGASDNEIIAAATSAKAWDFIQELTDQSGNSGLDAHVGERGVKLSGGQRQRIILARVILKNAPILILDEATSALDSAVEAEIQKTLYDMMQGKTVIAIAHRLSTIAKMDRIVVMHDGTVVEQGRHDDLLAQGGRYAQLWGHQTGG